MKVNEFLDYRFRLRFMRQSIIPSVLRALNVNMENDRNIFFRVY